MTLISFDDNRAGAAEELAELADAAPQLAPVADLDEVTRDPRELRAAFGRFPSGIAALCAEVDDERLAMVVTSFSVGVSFEPAIVMFSIQNSSSTWPRLRRSGRIGVSVLASDHAHLVHQLASRSGDRFAGIDTVATDAGAVLIADSAILMECEILSESPAGDHQVVLLEVKGIRVEAEVEPLVYHGAQFWRLGASADAARAS